MKNSAQIVLTVDAALQKENARLQEENVNLKAKTISLQNRIDALEKMLANSTDATFREMLRGIDGAKHEKIPETPDA